MKRFTKKLPDGRVVLNRGYANIFSTKHGNFIEGNAIDRFAEYEDLEEKGHLIRIPCKPSKITHDINIVNGHEERNIIYEQIVSCVTPSKRGYILYTCGNQNIVLEEEYKNTWFLEKKEAKAALKKMGDRV